MRGRQVVDRNGDEVGKVEGLIIDEQERRVRFLEVGSGGFLGLGEPVYNPNVVPQRDYFEDVYQYYGYPPFWGPFGR